MVVPLKGGAFRDLTPCSMAEVHLRFGISGCFHHQD